MFKSIALITFFLVFSVVSAQQAPELPTDFRQHTLTQYNSSIVNPVFSLDRNNPQSLSVWSRWQWQDIDANPTSLFTNYTRSINEKSAFGLSFFQHNTGVFFNTGGAANYAYEIKFNSKVRLSLGTNIYVYNRKLANNLTANDLEVLGLPLLGTDLIVQAAPGLNLAIKNFSLSVTSENLIDYNLDDKEVVTDFSAKTLFVMASHDFPVRSVDSTAFVRPAVYMKTIPGFDNQIGGNVLFSKEKYWLQAGYNTYYGASAGIGTTLFNRLSVGGVVEFGSGSKQEIDDLTFEIVASYFMGNSEKRRRKVINDFDDLEKSLAEDERNREVKIQEELDKAKELVKNEKIIEPEEQVKETNEQQARVEEEVEPTVDAIETAIETELIDPEKELTKREKRKIAALEKSRKKDSIAAVERELEQLQQSEQEAVLDAQQAKMKEAAELQRIREEQAQVDQLKAVEAAKAKTANSILQLEKEKEVIQQNETEEVIASNEEVTPLPGEKYIEVKAEGDLEPGYYLIANVFGTKKYFNLFMNDLRKKGFNPGSFVRKSNNYNHVYLKRYNTIKEIRQARASKFDGKYTAITWIFRVRGK